MRTILKTMAVPILFAATSCVGQPVSDEAMNHVIDQAVLDSATVLVVDSTDHRFEHLPNANGMLVYKDSLLIVSRSFQAFGEPILSLYDLGNSMHHLGDYIPRGSDIDEMVACGIQIIGDGLFVNDCYYTKRYCTIDLRKPLLPADRLHLSHSGVEERGVAAVPFQDGLLVENPQCYSNDEAGIHNDVPRLLFYRQGRCLTPQEHVTYQVADVNTGADLHYNAAHHRVCFVSHCQPLVEFYDDSLQLVRRLTLPSDGAAKIHVGAARTTMHQQRARRDRASAINATFEKTQRVVGAGSQLHAFLCSAADDEYIYLVYCGKLFGFDFHTYPTYILVLDWNGMLVEAYQFNRWVQEISPSMERGNFYLTVYADDTHDSAGMKLVKVSPQQSEQTDSLMTDYRDSIK